MNDEHEMFCSASRIFTYMNTRRETDEMRNRFFFSTSLDTIAEPWMLKKHGSQALITPQRQTTLRRRQIHQTPSYSYSAKATPCIQTHFRAAASNIYAHHHEKVSGRGWPCRNALKSTSDRPGCEKGASWEAPLMVANDSAPPPYT
jgi:hypothetical protein